MRSDIKRLSTANEVQQSLFYHRRDKDERISASIDQINGLLGQIQLDMQCKERMNLVH